MNRVACGHEVCKDCLDGSEVQFAAEYFETTVWVVVMKSFLCVTLEQIVCK